MAESALKDAWERNAQQDFDVRDMRMKQCVQQEVTIFLAWHGAAMETMIFVDVLEIAGNLKLCYKVAKLVRTRPDGPGHRFGFKKCFPLKWLAGKLFKGKSLQ